MTSDDAESISEGKISHSTAILRSVLVVVEEDVVVVVSGREQDPSPRGGVDDGIGSAIHDEIVIGRDPSPRVGIAFIIIIDIDYIAIINLVYELAADGIEVIASGTTVATARAAGWIVIYLIVRQ